MDETKKLPTNGELREWAREKWCLTNDNIQIDENAKVSRADDGAWVHAWVWVPYTE